MSKPTCDCYGKYDDEYYFPASAVEEIAQAEEILKKHKIFVESYFMEDRLEIWRAKEYTHCPKCGKPAEEEE